MKLLLDFIAKYESGGDYNIVWGNIKSQHRPKKPLIKMTIKEVLAWQDSIDRIYQSEAAGRYQIMEDTLRYLPPAAGLLLTDLFNETNQDRLAIVLLKRRGLDSYISGKISAEEFANNVAKEWASLPVVTGPNKGKSYYAGDGLNMSHAHVEDYLSIIKALKVYHVPIPITPPENFLTRLLKRFFSSI